MSNSVAVKKQFSVEISTDKFQKAIMNTLRDPDRARRFTTSLVASVSNNPALQECETGSIVAAALIGESLNLAPSPQLGHYYLVPFNDTKRGCKVAQFQISYRGYVQLAIRSGNYKKLNVLAIKEGELVRFDPLNEEIEVNLIADEAEREKAPTIGYYAMFEYTNGFRKAMYWTKEKMEAHALKYSMGYKAKKGYTFWEKDFDGMAIKTMLRQIISKWGIMSIEMQEGHAKDMSTFNADGSVNTVEFDAPTDAAPVADDDLKIEGEPDFVSLDDVE